MHNTVKLTSIIFAIAFLGSVECSYLDMRPGQVRLDITKTANSDLFSVSNKLIYLVYSNKIYEVLNIFATLKTNVVPRAYAAGKVLPPVFLKEKQTNGTLSDYYQGLLVQDKPIVSAASTGSEDGTQVTDDTKQTDTGYKLFFPRYKNQEGYVFTIINISAQQLKDLTAYQYKTEGIKDLTKKSKVQGIILFEEGNSQQGTSSKQYTVEWDGTRKYYKLEEVNSSTAPASNL